MTSAEYAGDTSLFCWNSKCPAARKRRNFYAYITGTDLFTGITHGGGLPEDSPAPYYRDAAYGIILGPYVLDLLDVSILNISSELRQIALIIILLKAGLSLDLKDLKKVGRSAVMLACVPATCELLAFVIFAPMILNISRVDAAVMGAVLAAVSPAVVVPRMVYSWRTAMVRRKAFRR